MYTYEAKEEKLMILPDKVYEVMRWVVITVIPATLLLYGVIGNTCGIPYTEVVLTIGAAVDTFLGTIFGISKISYDLKNRGKNEGM